jgi:hypothetical protein
MAEAFFQEATYSVPDSWMSSVNPTTNYGANTSFWIGYKGTLPKDARRSIMTFPVGDEMPVSTHVRLNDSELVFRVISLPAASMDVTFARITREGWLEAFVDWSVWGPLQPWTAGGGDTSSPTHGATIPTWTADSYWRQTSVEGIEALIVDATDNRSGLMHFSIKKTTESGRTDYLAEFRSSEDGTAAWRPSLWVDFEQRPSCGAHHNNGLVVMAAAA